MANSSINTFHGDAIRHIDPLKKADTAKQRELIQADLSCQSCKYFTLRKSRCNLKKKLVKFYNICKMHNSEILS